MLLWGLLDERHNGVFVEAGASDGFNDSTCRTFEEFFEWTGCNVEPDPTLFRSLMRNRPQSVNLCLALSNADGEALFTKPMHAALLDQSNQGSLAHTDYHRQVLDAAGYWYEQFPVPTITWPTLMARTGYRHVDLFVLDVEGYEVEVVDAMAGVLPEWLVAEWSLCGAERLQAACVRQGYGLVRRHEQNAIYRLEAV